MSCFCRRCCTSGIHPDGVKSRTRGQKGESRRTVQAPMSGSPAVCRKQNVQSWGKPKEVRGGQDGSVSGCWWPLRICPAYPAVSYRLVSIHYQDCLWWDEEADENGLYFFSWQRIVFSLYTPFLRDFTVRGEIYAVLRVLRTSKSGLCHHESPYDSVYTKFFITHYSFAFLYYLKHI